jgi:hypothetical protein
MDDHVAIEMQFRPLQEANHGRRSVVPLHRYSIGEALEGRKHARVIQGLRNEVTEMSAALFHGPPRRRTAAHLARYFVHWHAHE